MTTRLSTRLPTTIASPLSSQLRRTFSSVAGGGNIVGGGSSSSGSGGAFVDADKDPAGSNQANLQRVINLQLLDAKAGSTVLETIAAAENNGWRSNFLSYMAAIEVGYDFIRHVDLIYRWFCFSFVFFVQWSEIDLICDAFRNVFRSMT